MRGAFVAGLVAMALGAASFATASAQDKKEVSPGAVTSASKMTALPSGGSAIKGGEAQVRSDIKAGKGQEAMSSGKTGVVESNAKTSEKARSN